MLTNITIALYRRLASVSKFLPRAPPRPRLCYLCLASQS